MKQNKKREAETGRKAQHQQGFSFVKQEVWATKGQTEELFQSAPLLSRCFHCHSRRRTAYRVVFVTWNPTVPENVSGVSVFVPDIMQLKKKKQASCVRMNLFEIMQFDHL